VQGDEVDGHQDGYREDDQQDRYDYNVSEHL
jgi:hypothetical protein